MNKFKAYWLHWTNKKFPCGMTSREAMTELQNNTNSGVLHKAPVVFDPSYSVNPRVYIYIQGYEFVEIDLVTGTRNCMELNQFAYYG